MRLQKTYFSFLLASTMGLTQINAYVPKHLGGEGLPAQASALQAETAILLDESGTPRCRIGKRPSEYLTAEQLEEFYKEDSQIDLATLDSLRECDENDEIYARIALEAEKISLGVVIPPNIMNIANGLFRVLILPLAIGGSVGCVFRKKGINSGFSDFVVYFAIVVSSPAALLYTLGHTSASVLITSSAISMNGGHLGLLFCD